MKKIAILCIAIVMICCGCEKKPQNSGDDSLSITKGILSDTVHQILGEPIETLSGFWGDVYVLDNGTKVTIYYDGNGRIEYIKVIDKDGVETYT